MKPPPLFSSVADGAFLTPGSGMNNPDHISESLETIFWVKILKFIDADPGTWMEKIRIRDRYGIRDGKIRIWYKHPVYATTLLYNGFSRYPTIKMARIADPNAVKV
jgi:hypothetical protein